MAKGKRLNMVGDAQALTATVTVPAQSGATTIAIDGRPARTN